MHVSVVVPVYNKENYIARTIESILAQTHQDFELILVDDESRDQSLAAMRAFTDPRLIIISQANKGQSAATNAGIARATGEIVAFLDGDDTWLPEHLEHLVSLRKRFPEAGLLSTGYRKTLGRGHVIDNTMEPVNNKSQRLVRNYFECVALAPYCPVWTGSVAIPRDIFSELGGFLEGELRAQDTEMWARVALYYPIAYDVRVTAIYDCSALGRGMVNDIVWYPPFVRTISKVLAGTHQGRPIDSEGLLNYKNRLLFMYIQRCLSAKNLSEIRRTMREEMYLDGLLARRLRIVRILVEIVPLKVVSLYFRILGSRIFNSGRQVRHSVVHHRYSIEPS